jgi:hypothetical protein
MRRFAYSEPFRKLILRDDGVVFAETTHNDVRILPALGTQFKQFVQAKTKPYLRLVRDVLVLPTLLAESLVWSTQHLPISSDSLRWTLAQAPQRDRRRVAPHTATEWSYPDTWPKPIAVTYAYELLPSPEPHVVYGWKDQSTVERIDFRTLKKRKATELAQVNLLNRWSHLRPALDLKSWLLVRYGEPLWRYDLVEHQAAEIALRLIPVQEMFLAAGWNRALIQTTRGLVVRTLDTNTELCRIEPPQFLAAHPVIALPFLERVLLVNHDYSVSLWDLDNGRLVQTWDWHVGRPLSVSVSPNGSMAAIAGDNLDVVIWDLDG